MTLQIHKITLWLLFVFIFLFPKGGIKTNNIPITWGYTLLALATFFSILRPKIRITKNRLYALFSLLPLQILIVYSLIINGNSHIGYTIALLMSLFIIPLGFYIGFSKELDEWHLDSFKKMLSQGMLFVSAYGIFLFWYKLLIGEFIEIPFLTVNFHDVGTLETTKYIDRGGIFKLISTYNNGNVYGICLLILLPFYNLIESSKIKRIIVKTSLLLTLSRTVWYGLIFTEILTYLYVYRITLKTWVKLPLVLLTYSQLIRWINKLLEYGNEFIFDTTMGGRQTQFSTFRNFTLFPSRPFHGIDEIVPLSMLNELGLMGIISYYIAFTVPIFLALNQKYKSQNQKSFIVGMITYMFVSLSDGAFLLIPTLAIFFFVASLAQQEKIYDPHVPKRAVF
ncbi:MAG: hypothetical protein P0S95_03665 [Rhabdochlamydiaceae bacterium]|nr:hypothetical protein [Candidatus Amphrikana amoebophyrae]